MPTRRLMPDVIKNQELTCLPPDATVRDAATLMAEKRIAAVLITEGRTLKGIVTERDMTTRVIAAGLAPDTTPLSAVMTADPDTLEPSATALAALDLMERHHYRHLPIAVNGEAVGMVSIRDLFAVVRTHLEDELRNREAYMFGSGYSAEATVG
ncbi:histidine kinase [Azospirillum sp. TSH100]|uniref:CBS domain-containing protein n=1 Tax=Azospirillum sp. TSH100 TaxID=652764 RepID=UPI000D603E75|nr:CBS domain-containing protein [Azospirillum sp. TSH100]PWC89089.1 histidine kinase [Azospirillum sp. TSH100]QCG87119.1 CBS domain-containing protein [Azospirillum sp. TSH100]